MPSVSSLPEKLISSILHAAIGIPDSVFTSNSARSPFAPSAVNYKASRLLLVCKIWRRIGTPLLFRTVIIRSLAQAKALLRAFESDKTLATLVRQLRVEGGFDPCMQDIFQACAGISDLCLLNNPFRDECTEGIRAGLAFINPSRLVLLNMGCNKKPNNNMKALANAIIAAMRDWGNLRTVLYAVPHRCGQDDLASSLAQVPQLRTVIFLSFVGILPYHREICENSSVERVIIRVDHSSRQRDLQRAFDKESAVVRAKLRFGLCSSSPVRRELSRSYCPLSVVPEEIWHRVLESAIISGPRFSDRTANVQNLFVLMACKKFMRIGLPIFLRTICINCRDVPGLVDFLASRPYQARHIRHITIFPPPGFDNREAVLAPLLRLVHKLEVFVSYASLSHMTWDEFGLLSERNGNTMKMLGALSLNMPGNVPVSIVPLFRFTHLRHLAWTSDTAFQTKARFPVDAFSALESMDIGQCDVSFIQIFASLRMVSLRAITFRWVGHHRHYHRLPLLLRHGGKIQSLVLLNFLDFATVCACPRIRHVTILGTYVNLVSPPGHLTLACIIFENIEHAKAVAWLAHWICRSPIFRALKSILWRRCRWPRTEREIAANPLVPVAEAIYEQRGVRIYNKDHVHWIPRLK
ncbi:hypothetical protein HDZ31DRAFT_79154 [Schizophyllum fasciatum]